MSIVIGIIFKDEAIIASDTRVSNYLDNFSLVKDGQRKIMTFTLGDDKFLIGVTGILTDIQRFNDILSTSYFPDIPIGHDSFVSRCIEIFNQHKIDNINLIIGGIENCLPKISLLNPSGYINSVSNNGEYVLSPPGSLNKNQFPMIHGFFSEFKPISTREEAIRLLHYVITKTSELDKGRTVNSDIHYAYLSLKGTFSSPKSHHGYDML